MITEKQRKARRNHLGASDTACLYGLNDFTTAYDLWMEKVYKLKDVEITETMRLGNELEPLIVRWIAKKLFLEVETDPEKLYYKSKEHPLFVCNVDSNVLNYPTKIEAKYSGNADIWGYSGSDEQNAIPGMYYIQCQQQLHCTGLDYIILAVWLAGYHGFDQRYYYVKRNEKVIDNLIKVGEKWWAKHIVPARKSDMPEKYAPLTSPIPNIGTFKRIERKPAKISPIKNETYLAWFDAKKAVREADKLKEQAFQSILKEIGDAEAGRLPCGIIWGYKKGKSRRNIDLDILKLKYPKIYDEMIQLKDISTFKEIK